MTDQHHDRPLVSIDDLSISFRTDEGLANAVSHVSLDIQRGEILGLVGESGCGKSVTAMSLLRLIPSPPGRIESGRAIFHDHDLLSMPIDELRQVRGNSIAMIFQEPMEALSPLHRIGEQLAETLRLHRPITRRDAWATACEWLQRVGIPEPAERMYAYPHQLSGGMRQRAMIAMAMMMKPELLIADEPTTALDVTIQAQIFDLIREMKDEHTSVLLITHDMGVVWEMCTRVAVMYASEIVEVGRVEAIFKDAMHPYTRALLESIPSLSTPGARLPAIAGQVPSAMALPSGCHFRERCRYAYERCEQAHPGLYQHDKRACRCFLAEENP